jgi:Di-haem oxidoreductase, putative peroxidase
MCLSQFYPSIAKVRSLQGVCVSSHSVAIFESSSRGYAACHINPAVGRASPATNPQVADANAMGATNVIPSFITANGPIREVRFILNPDGTPDGGVHDLFSIQGRSDAPGCVFAQPDFAAQVAAHNVIFRIPISTYGDGLVEGLSDLSLQNTFAAQAQQNGSLGISGHFNLSGNTGNITRFGWKAQNASLLMFAGEAYNVEEGVTNDLFPNERNSSASPQCSPAPLPEDTVPTADGGDSNSPASDFSSDITNFTMFMRMLAAPTPAVPFTTSSTASTTPASTATATTASTTASTTAGSTTVAMASVLPTAAASSTPSTSTSSAAAASSSSTTSAASIQAGFQAFNNIGCSGCHIVGQTTANLAIMDTTTNAAVSNTSINTFSDYAVHSMGTGLADHVSQGNANGFQFRSAPLWGVGQRVFFLHDGRTNDLMQAIQQHASSGSEANQVINAFNMLGTTDQQNILNFLRDL